MTTTFRRLAPSIAAALTMASLGAAPAQAQWWTCPTGQGDFELEETTNDRVRCHRDAGVDRVASICPNRDVNSSVADRCQTPNAPVGGWGPAACPAAVPPYTLMTRVGPDTCERTLSTVNLAPSRQVN